MAFYLQMKKVYRILKNQEFKKILDQRKRSQNDSFKIAYTNKSFDHARLGISVSKKLGNAVIRNKIKRQVRMMVDYIVDFNAYEYDVIIIVKKEYLLKSYETNQNYLETLLKKCKIK